MQNEIENVDEMIQKKIRDKASTFRSQVMKNVSKENHKIHFILNDDINKKREYYFMRSSPFEMTMLANDVIRSLGFQEMTLGVLPAVTNELFCKVVDEMLASRTLYIKREKENNKVHQVTCRNDFNSHFKDYLHDIMPVIAGIIYHSVLPFFSLVWNPNGEKELEAVTR